jgi:hypothetical protein
VVEAMGFVASGLSMKLGLIVLAVVATALPVLAASHGTPGKRDPSFPDVCDPNYVQLIRVFVSVVPHDTVAARRDTMQRTMDTLDDGALARLLR